jgi:hypothetical protein
LWFFATFGKKWGLKNAKWGFYMRLPFSTDEWDFESLTHRRSMADWRRQQRNGRKFIEWMMRVFKQNAPRELGHGEQYHCQGMRLHPRNNEYLRNHIDPWTWLDLSPVDDENVGLDELEIDHFFITRGVES